MTEYINKLLSGRIYEVKIFNLGDTIQYQRDKLTVIYFVFNKIENITSIDINSVDNKIFENREVSYFRFVQTYKHLEEMPPDNIGMYSFALDPLSYSNSGYTDCPINIKFNYKENDTVTIYFQYMSIGHNIKGYDKKVNF